MNFFFIIILTGFHIGTLSTVVFDACQNSTNEAHSFRVIGSYYQDHPGICTCTIRILFFELITVQEIHTNFSLYGDKCGYFISTHKMEANKCTVCLNFSDMVFKRSENFTVYFERPSDYQLNQIWFDVSIPPVEHDIWLKINCWLDERKEKTPACDPPVQSSPRATGNETTTKEEDVSVANKCGDIVLDYTCTSDFTCILGWVIASLSLAFCLGVVLYHRIQFHKQNIQKMKSHASSDHLVENSSPVSVDQTDYVSAEYLDLSDIPLSGYQHLQFQGAAVDNVYEQLVEERNNTNNTYLVPNSTN